ncbi:MarR family transcriptional regulator [Paenibacillus sp. HN-1]|uniref:MarR family winged helix-turn-helix transcriptional regulator n=1 Tax=Paenibacillus TaxID=44249 RepID=UPI001CA8D3DC|nr:MULTISPECIES: MarR family transcriptional regulator [Paenibacillus]MBY9080293.1 MarR family transcriptional regulator [Paenibacillus sp. CGMCC 1.18879]MBY9083048.1 MarR family transcriptional regulator [Paenibacillus sinensis]
MEVIVIEDMRGGLPDQPLHSEVFFMLVETTAKLVEVSEKYWQAQGTNGARIRILVELLKEGGTLLPSALARKIGVTKANISLLLIPLEQDGYIRRQPHPEDGRKTVIILTDEGHSLLLRHLPANRETIAHSMQALNDQELHQLLSLLARLKKA